jgi:hypothetical protein
LGKKYLKYNSIENWLDGIRNASFIITDSFHCLIFSIIFQKNFVCIPNKRGGISRIENLLKMFELEDRLCVPESFELNHYASKPINYKLVNEKWDYYKSKSLEYIKNAIKI